MSNTLPTKPRFSTDGDAIPQEIEFMTGLIKEFSDFVIDSMHDGMHLEFSDHNVFIKAALEAFLEFQDGTTEIG